MVGCDKIFNNAKNIKPHLKAHVICLFKSLA